MKKSVVFISTLVASQTVLSAGLESLNKQQLQAAIVNKTVVSIPSNVFSSHGQEVTQAFSFYLDDKGNMKGQFAAKPKNDPQSDVGTYKIDADGSVHTTWQHWYGGKTLCWHFYDAANAYIALECNKIFHTAYLKNEIKEGDQLK